MKAMLIAKLKKTPDFQKVFDEFEIEIAERKKKKQENESPSAQPTASQESEPKKFVSSDSAPKSLS